MTSSYVNDLRLNEMATGDASGTWGTVTNTNLELIGEALGYGTEAITTNADTHTSTVADGATDPARAMFIKYTGTLDSTCTITIAPNTLKRLHFIHNATSGSQSIIIKQGSGATITIPTGDTKAVYLDGAGSGAAVTDAFASLSVVDLKVQDDLSFTSDSAVVSFGADADTTLTHTDGSGLTLNGTNKLMFNDASQFIQGASATVLDIAATDEIELTATLIDVVGNQTVSGTLGVTGVLTGTSLDISGDIDVDGTTNLDVVDIDGAVDMATTLAVAGNVDFNGDLDVDGTTNLDVVDIDGAVDMASTALVTGVLTANGGAVFNEGGADVDFRVESDTLTHALFVDGETGSVGIGTSSPSTYGNFAIRGGLTVNAGSTSITGVSFSTSDAANSTFWINHASSTTNLITDVPMAFYTASGSGVAERMRINSSGQLAIGSSTARGKVTINVDSASNDGLYMDNANGSASLDISLLGSTYNAHGANAGEIWFYSPDNINIGGATGNTNAIKFLGGGAERMRITSAGSVFVGCTASPSSTVNGAGFISTNYSELYLSNGGTSSNPRIRFFNANGEVGSITTADSATAYNTSSDYRLKENVVTNWDATTRLKQLKPSRFNFIADASKTVDGFLAHEVQEIVPEAITGTKDALDADGNAVMQGIDQSKLVPLLVKTIQELEARITALEGA
jgi:hypothetical protein